MALTPQEQIVARAIDVITSVTATTMRRTSRGSMHYVSANALRELAHAIDAVYPGIIAATRRAIEEKNRT